MLDTMRSIVNLVLYLCVFVIVVLIAAGFFGMGYQVLIGAPIFGSQVAQVGTGILLTSIGVGLSGLVVRVILG